MDAVGARCREKPAVSVVKVAWSSWARRSATSRATSSREKLDTSASTLDHGFVVPSGCDDRSM